VNNLELSPNQADNLGRWYSEGFRRSKNSIGFSVCITRNPRPKIDSADTECFNLYQQSFSKNSGFPKPEGDLAPMSEMVAELVEFKYPKFDLGLTGVPLTESYFEPGKGPSLNIPNNPSSGLLKNSRKLSRVTQTDLIELKKSVLQMSHI
jgi:hypothetical protein